MRPFIKILGIIPVLIGYLLISGAVTIVPAPPRVRRRFLTGTTSVFCRIMLGLLGIRLAVRNRERLRKLETGVLIVSNHVSYVDVLIIASIVPSVFITSVELRSTLLLGMLASLGGSLFVERRKASGLRKEILLISRVLKEGVPVTLFPEGTTSNGERVQPFKNPLFEAAVRARADILPLCLHYRNVNKEQITHANRDSVFYYGSTPFFQHFPRLLSLSSVDVDVMPLRRIRVHGSDSRKELAARSHTAISAAYPGRYQEQGIRNEGSSKASRNP